MSKRVHTCRCGVAFVFRRHETGPKSAPIETEPSADGNVAVLPDGRYRISAGGDGPRYVNHFARCPFAKGFRR